MSWASARAAHGLDTELDTPREGPHERGYRVAWRIATAGVVALVATLVGALALAVTRDGLGWDAPTGVNTALTVLALASWTLLGGAFLAMLATDAVDRRTAWRDDELQLALPPDHALRRR